MSYFAQQNAESVGARERGGFVEVVGRNEGKLTLKHLIILNVHVLSVHVEFDLAHGNIHYGALVPAIVVIAIVVAG